MRVLLLLTALFVLAACSGTQAEIRRVNPSGLYTPRGYSHVVTATGGRTIYIAGQPPLDKEGKIVGVGDFTTQARQVFENIRTALESQGASLKDLVKLNLYLVDASQIAKFREVREQYIASDFPATTTVEVRALLRPEAMLVMDAVAVTSR
jgi:enamine deaminase RidA (YjgF/YER057c/UK114 family)